MPTDLPSLIKHHNFWSTKDFENGQMILWIAILSSAVATILSSIDNVPKWIYATTALLPGLALIVNKTFRFRERSNWHEMYSIRLQEIDGQVELKTISAAEALAKITALRIEMHKVWPGENTSAIPKDPG